MPSLQGRKQVLQHYFCFFVFSRPWTLFTYKAYDLQQSAVTLDEYELYRVVRIWALFENVLIFFILKNKYRLLETEWGPKYVMNPRLFNDHVFCHVHISLFCMMGHLSYFNSFIFSYNSSLFLSFHVSFLSLFPRFFLPFFLTSFHHFIFTLSFIWSSLSFLFPPFLIRLLSIVL
jgi:hypothetical protein